MGEGVTVRSAGVLGFLCPRNFTHSSSPIYDRTCSTKAGVMDDCGGVR